MRAAAALCEHYVRRGDRVGLQVVRAQTPAYIRASTGKLHLRRMLATLALTRAGGLLVDDRETPPRLRVNPGAIVFMCSPLISQSTMQRAISLAASRPDARRGRHVALGHRAHPMRTIAATVDDAGLADPDARTSADAAPDRSRIPVVPWRGPGSLDQVLRDVARRAEHHGWPSDEGAFVVEEFTDRCVGPPVRRVDPDVAPIAALVVVGDHRRGRRAQRFLAVLWS